MELDLISEWFQYADMDLDSAEYLQGKRPIPLEIICFLCQQSAEKNLKGYLIFKGTPEPPKIHNLLILNKMCIEHDNRFREVERACDMLNRYGVQPRYPNELGITENDMRKALEYARQIRDFEPLANTRLDLNNET
ncbi:MAG: HEPN domain-containing protein [Oscillospiraceae bacterium]|nr:HEPN domain-containing protein [Oscillospiraceae bacterium]